MSMLLQLKMMVVCLFCFNTLSYAKPIHRIISLSPHITELVFALDAGDKIIATTEFSDFPEAAKSIPKIGNAYGLQIEKIIALRPDVVIAWPGGNQKSDLDKLRNFQIKVVYSHPKSIKELLEHILELGHLLGEVSTAKTLVEELTQTHQKLLSKYQTKKKIKLFYQLWDNPLRSIGKGSWINELIETCGGENIFYDSNVAYPFVSKEAVMLKQPELILIPKSTSEMANAYDKSHILKEVKKTFPVWKPIPAISDDKVFVFNADILHRTTPRAIQQLSLLCQIMDNARN